MITQYFLKFISDPGNKISRQTIVDESVDVLGLRSIRLGGVTFDETNIVTVSGVNSLETVIDSISSASDDRDDYILSLLTTVSGAQTVDILGVSSASDDNDDYIISLLSSVSSSLNVDILGVSSSSDDNDDFILDTLTNVSGNLQVQLNAITSDVAKEERFFVSGGQALLEVGAFTFDSSNFVKDIKVYKNGNVLFQSSSGGIPGEKTGGDFEKLSDTQISLFIPGKDGDRYVVRDERTGGGGGGGGSTDLENIVVDTKPAINGAVSLGGIGKGWQSLFLNDVTNTDVYELQISGGVLQAILV